jgi:hypothetical protein
MRWFQPYGGGLLAKRWQPNKIVVLATTDAGEGKVEDGRDAAPEQIGGRHVAHRALDSPHV